MKKLSTSIFAGMSVALLMGASTLVMADDDGGMTAPVPMPTPPVAAPMPAPPVATPIPMPTPPAPAGGDD